MNVLLIDDEPDFCRVVTAALESTTSWQVRTAHSGAEGLDLAREERPDVVLVDMVMPVMDGRATIAALDADAATTGIPTIIVTGRTDITDTDVIRKPFDPLLLAECVAAMLTTISKRRRERVLRAAIDASWVTHRADTEQHLVVIDTAIGTGRGATDGATLAAARQAAHDLIGTLGMFELRAAVAHARALETLLDSETQAMSAIDEMTACARLLRDEIELHDRTVAARTQEQR